MQSIQSITHNPNPNKKIRKTKVFKISDEIEECILIEKFEIE